LNLLHEGYNKRVAEQWEMQKFQAYNTYACTTAAAGVEPKSFEEWSKPEATAKSTNKPPKAARRISLKKKLAMEAKMNESG